jgi:hypothetical protein
MAAAAGSVPVLQADAVYIAHDRTVCANSSCAGATARYTGRTIGDATLLRVTTADVAEWAAYDLGPLTCECGAITLTDIAGDDDWPIPHA